MINKHIELWTYYNRENDPIRKILNIQITFLFFTIFSGSYILEDDEEEHYSIRVQNLGV